MVDASSGGWSSGGDEYRLPAPPRINRRQPVPPPASRTQPTQDTESTKDVLSRTIARIWFERNADRAYNVLKKDQMHNRMAELRKELEHIEKTEWYYEPCDNLIGQY